MSDETLLTEQAAARMLGLKNAVSLRNARYRARSGKGSSQLATLPHVQVGRLIRYRLGDVQRFIEDNTSKPAA